MVQQVNLLKFLCRSYTKLYSTTTSASSKHSLSYLENFGIVSELSSSTLLLRGQQHFSTSHHTTHDDDISMCDGHLDEKQAFPDKMGEIERAFVDLMDHFKDANKIDALRPLLTPTVLLEDRIRGASIRGHKQIKLHILRMNMWNSIKYTYFGFDTICSGTIPNERKILLIRRMYAKRGGQYKIFSVVGYLIKRLSQRIADPIGSQTTDGKRKHLPPNTQIFDEFMGIHVGEDSLVDHIVIRQVFKSDYDFIKKLEGMDEVK